MPFSMKRKKKTKDFNYFCPVRTMAAIPFRGKREKPPYRASLSRRTGKPPSM